jgi:hypothetical protein
VPPVPLLLLEALMEEELPPCPPLPPVPLLLTVFVLSPPQPTATVVTSARAQ